MDWSRYPNFTEAELACRHTGRNLMHPETMARLQRVRDHYGRPMRISSGYRDPSHPAERGKAQPGAHAMGRAVDVLVHGADALQLIVIALAQGFHGIGVQQKGPHASRFIHLDDMHTESGFQRPAIWSY